jgi:hypothetical protein
MEISDLNSVLAHRSAKKLRLTGHLGGEELVKRASRHGKDAWEVRVSGVDAYLKAIAHIG